LTFLLSAIDPIGGWLGEDFAMSKLSVGTFGAILTFSIQYVPSVIAATMIVLTSHLHCRPGPPTPSAGAISRLACIAAKRRFVSCS
jgi:hypothetical protein